MTALATAPSTTDAVKSFKGGWKDAGLRAAGSRVNLSQPLIPGFRNSLWNKPRHIPVIDSDGHVRSADGTFAFEVCPHPRCHRWTGRFWKLDDDGAKYIQQALESRPPCRCPKAGAKLIDADPVPLPELGLNGISLGVLVRAGILTTHDAAEMGFLAMYELDGVGSKSVDALRAAVLANDLPEVPA